MTLDKKQMLAMMDAVQVILELRDTEGRSNPLQAGSTINVVAGVNYSRINTEHWRESLSAKILGTWSSGFYAQAAIDKIGRKRIIKAVKTLAGA